MPGRKAVHRSGRVEVDALSKSSWLQNFPVEGIRPARLTAIRINLTLATVKTNGTQINPLEPLGDSRFIQWDDRDRALHQPGRSRRGVHVVVKESMSDHGVGGMVSEPGKIVRVNQIQPAERVRTDHIIPWLWK